MIVSVVIVAAVAVLAIVYHKSIVAKIKQEIADAEALKASAKKAAVADLQDVTADIEDLTKKV